MKCHGCGMSMVVDHTETVGHACTSWHRCPLCRKVRLVSQPDDPYDKRYSGPGESSAADDLSTERRNRPVFA